MRILICSDGSEHAERAVRLGATLAAACRAGVTLLGIIESPGSSRSILDSVRRAQALLEDKRIHAELITKSGKPIEEIVRRTQEAHYDLVVVGGARKAAFGPFRISSKTYKIIKEIEPPVLTVTGKCPALKRILICSGGRQYIDGAVKLAGEIAQGLGSAVTLLHVVPKPPALYAHLPLMKETVDRLLDSPSELGRNLRQHKGILDGFGVPVEVRLRRGPVLDEILQEIEEGNYDLVVTGSALSRSLRTYILGDISREIVNRAGCAVLVARAQE